MRLAQSCHCWRTSQRNGVPARFCSYGRDGQTYRRCNQ